MESDSSAAGQLPVTVPHQTIIHSNQLMAQNQLLPQQTQPLMMQLGMTGMGNGLGVIASQTGFYPSPPSTTETESSTSLMGQQQLQQQQQQRRGIIDANGGPQETTGRYPEYKH